MEAGNYVVVDLVEITLDGDEVSGCGVRDRAERRKPAQPPFKRFAIPRSGH
jgi:hypothetical protein